MLCELAHTRRGHGEPLVLFHGIGHRRAAFDPVIDDLARTYDVIAADLPGLGDSPQLPKGVEYSAENVVAAIVENFHAWGVEEPHVVGNSLGGLVAIALAQSGHARSATGLSPAGYFKPWSLLQASAALLPLKIGAYLPAPVLKVVASTPPGRLFIGWTLYRHPLRHRPETTYLDSLAMKKGKGFWPYFLRCIPLGFRTPEVLCGDARVPITIAWGDHDLVLHRSQAQTAAAKLGGVELVTLRDCGHIPMSDSPDQVIYAIERTVSRTRSTSTDSSASSVA